MSKELLHQLFHQAWLADFRRRLYPLPWVLEPYRLLTVHGGLYCLGQVPPRKNLTTLAVDRIRSLEMTKDSFIGDPDFDPKRYEEESFGIVWETPMTVVIRFRKDQAPYVMEREWHPTQRVRTLENGCIELTFHAGGTFEIVRWILGWGDAAEVLQPKTLRTLVGECLRLATKIYSLGD